MVPLNDLKRQADDLAVPLAEAIGRVARSGWYVLGQEVAAFEKEFAAYCGTADCVSVANGTDALELALRALEVKPGSKVVTVANAGLYSTIAVNLVGARPAYVDVDPATLLMSPQALAAIDWREVSAVIVTHLYGRLAEVERIAEIARKAGVPLVEDCAQAHGASRNGRRAGSFGALACFSFYPTKNLGALGDGGAVVGSEPSLMGRIRQLRQYGWSRKYTSTLAYGRNSRLDEMQAAVLRLKLPRLDAWNERRRAIARLYRERLRHPEVACGPAAGAADVVHLFVVRARERDSLARHCAANGITTDVHYPIPDHRQPSMEGLASDAALPETDRACAEVLTLPCFPELRDDEVIEVAEAVNAWSP